MPPTEVTLIRFLRLPKQHGSNRFTHKGHPDGKVGLNTVHDEFQWLPETPPSPDEYSTETPLAPNCASMLHRLLYTVTSSLSSTYLQQKYKTYLARFGEMRSSVSP